MDSEAAPNLITATVTTAAGPFPDPGRTVSQATTERHDTLVEATPVENAVEAHVVNIDDTMQVGKSKNTWVIFVATGVVALVATLSVSLWARNSSGSKRNGAPAIDPKRREFILSIVAPLSGIEVFDPKSPEFSADRLAALDWLLEQDQKSSFQLDDSSLFWHIRQLYIVSLFYFATNGEEWDQQFQFLQGTNECHWSSIHSCDDDETIDCKPFDSQGVICNDKGRVTKFYLWWNNLSGTLPHEISYLNETLVEFNIGGGSILGTIPSSIQQLSNLDVFGINDHCLTGTIPDLTHLPLTSLSVYNNPELSGSLNGFCSGSEFIEGVNAVAAECSCDKGAESKIDCDCCLCCEMSTFECCDRHSDTRWTNVPLDKFTTDGFLKAYEKPCLTEASRQYIDEVCPCIYEADHQDPFRLTTVCTTNCSREDAFPSYSSF
mmetsp:Transcript_4289/g.10352  ORF Transcript_4289/g.10352 Transcript_4289/m.10352 type:complete len:435 (+) Transcript_4289:206-1510(+)